MSLMLPCQVLEEFPMFLSGPPEKRSMGPLGSTPAGCQATGDAPNNRGNLTFGTLVPLKGRWASKTLSTSM